ncbi:MAG: hypothetical protein PVF05_12205 [Gemmatimonadales bacterium]|jgi:hypothetical protein
MRLRSMVLLFGLTLAPLAACARGDDLVGTWSDDHGVVSYEFAPDGKVTITGPFGGGVELDYERDGDRVLVGPEGTRQVLTFTEDGDLDIGMAVLHKQD